MCGGLADYQACMRLLYVYANGSDPAWDMTLSVSAGALVGMPAFTGLATEVNVLGPDWSPGLLFQGSADASSIQFQIANGGNVITYFFVFEYWYET